MLDLLRAALGAAKVAILFVALLLPLAAFALKTRDQNLSLADVQGSPPPQASAERGRQLFQGTARFQNRGPACGSCHGSAGLDFPNGGTLGPDLTGIYQRMGPDAMSVILQTLYFPTMNPIFASRPLTPQDQGDLMAFLQQSGTGPAPAVTQKISGIAVLGLILLLVVSGAIWRKRLRDVRKSLVQAAVGKGAGRA